MRADKCKTLTIKAKVAFGDFSLDVDQQIALQGVTGLFGPSGGGKSTLLRIIAGLEPLARGQLNFAGESWLDSDIRHFVPADKRPVGFVFQDGRLFEHLTVEGNLQYAVDRGSQKQSSIRYEDVLASFDLQSLLQRHPDALSGGERQRVAIARTVLNSPQILLLDEPLAALDAGRKGEILPYLDDLTARFGIPAIYVSHTIDEIARLADRVIVLEQGRVKAHGEAAEVLNQIDMQSPSSKFDIVTILQTRLLEHLPKLALSRLDHHGQTVVVPMLNNRHKGDVVRLHIRAGDVALATREPEGISFRNIMKGTVTDLDADAASAFAMVSVDIGGAIVRSQLTRQAVAELDLRPGMKIFVLLKTATFDRRS
jgi:molybdate transport system ATP-binding protein